MSRIVLILILATLGFILLLWLFPFVSVGGEERAEVFYRLVLILLLVSSAVVSFSGNMKGALKYAAWWVLIFLVLVTGYSFKPELTVLKNRMLAEFLPYQPVENAEGKVVFKKSDDGHFYIKAEVNGAPVLFLLDTGASNIVLTPADAKRAGINLDSLVFNQIYNTANGKGTGAGVRLKRLQIGSITLDNIGAAVNGAEMDRSLLGMRFLESLKSYRVEGDTLVLEP